MLRIVKWTVPALITASLLFSCENPAIFQPEDLMATQTEGSWDPSAEARTVSASYTYTPNAVISGDWSYVRDINGTIISGKRVDIGDRITVMDVSLSRNLALVEYPVPTGIEKGYYITAANNIKYYNPGNWKNGSTSEKVYASNGTSQIATLNPYATGTLLYKKTINGKTMYHIVYNYNGGINNMSGYVFYSGGLATSGVQYPIANYSSTSINSTLHGRSVYRDDDVPGHNVFKGYSEWYNNGHVGIGDGLDLGGSVGQSVYAVKRCEVIQINNVGSSTENVWVRWNNNCYAVYAHITHNSSLYVGKWIDPGTSIGTLRSLSWPHLHFELWMNGSAVYAKSPSALREAIKAELN